MAHEYFYHKRMTDEDIGAAVGIAPIQVTRARGDVIILEFERELTPPEEVALAAFMGAHGYPGKTDRTEFEEWRKPRPDVIGAPDGGG